MAAGRVGVSIGAMKWLDTPPVWLVGCLVLAWAMARLWPEPALGAWAGWAGPVLILAGLALIAAAAWEFRRAQTTIVPHETPRALIDGGVYRLSRNPIYLGDALILLGAILLWRAPLSLLLVPVFVWIVQVRFVQPEEARLAATFPDAYRAYAARVRRWL